MPLPWPAASSSEPGECFRTDIKTRRNILVSQVRENTPLHLFLYQRDVVLFHSFVTIPHYVLYIIIYCFRVISRQAKYRAYFTLLGSGQPRVHPSALFNFNLLLSIVLFIMSIYLKLTGVFGWHNLRKGSSSPGGVEEPRAPRPTTVLTCTIWER